MPNSGHMPDNHPDVPENVWKIAIADLPGTVQGLYDEKCRAALHKLKEAA